MSKYELVAIKTKDWQSVGIGNKETNNVEIHINIVGKMKYSDAKKLGNRITKFLNQKEATNV